MEPAYLFIYPFINHLLLVLIITFMNSRAVSTVELWAEKNLILYYIPVKMLDMFKLHHTAFEQLVCIS